MSTPTPISYGQATQKIISASDPSELNDLASSFVENLAEKITHAYSNTDLENKTSRRQKTKYYTLDRHEYKRSNDRANYLMQMGVILIIVGLFSFVIELMYPLNKKSSDSFVKWISFAAGLWSIAQGRGQSNLLEKMQKET